MGGLRNDATKTGMRTNSFSGIKMYADSSNTEPAGFILRLAAWGWDSTVVGVLQVILLLMIVVLLSLLGLFSLGLGGSSSLSDLLTSWQTSFGSAAIKYGLVGALLLSLATPILLLLVYILYFSILEAFCQGKTLGKYLVGIQVFNAYDEPPSFGSAFSRNLYKFAPLGLVAFCLALSLGLVGAVPGGRLVMLLLVPLSVVGGLVMFVADYVWILVSSHKQALHDKWSYCYVVLDDQYSSQWRGVFAGISIALIVLWLGLGIAFAGTDSSTGSALQVGSIRSERIVSK